MNYFATLTLLYTACFAFSCCHGLRFGPWVRLVRPHYKMVLHGAGGSRGIAYMQK